VVGTGAAFGAEADTAGQTSTKIEDRGGQSGSITCAVLAICSTRSDAIQKKTDALVKYGELPYKLSEGE
jgi:hypothetical protein